MRRIIFLVSSLSSLGVYGLDKAGPSISTSADRSYIGHPCSISDQSFSCQMLSEDGCPHGTFVPNYCPGSVDIQCCVTHSPQKSLSEKHLQSNSNMMSMDNSSGMAMHHVSDGYAEDSFTYHYTDCEDYDEGEKFDFLNFFYPDDFDYSSPSGKPVPLPNPGGSGEHIPGGGSGKDTKLRSGKALTVIEHPRVTGVQLAVSKDFAPYVQHVIDCLPDNGAKIRVTSAARTCIPSGGVSNSMHMLGKAFDFNIDMNGSMCTWDCLDSCWQGRAQSQFSWIKGWIECAQSRGLEYGGTYSSSDPVHFTIKRQGDFNSEKAVFKPELDAYCSNSLPGVPKGEVGQSTCGCS